MRPRFSMPGPRTLALRQAVLRDLHLAQKAQASTPLPQSQHASAHSPVPAVAASSSHTLNADAVNEASQELPTGMTDEAFIPVGV